MFATDHIASVVSGAEAFASRAAGRCRRDDGPGGIALLDHETFDVLRAWETDERAAALPLRRLVAPQQERADLE